MNKQMEYEFNKYSEGINLYKELIHNPESNQNHILHYCNDYYLPKVICMDGQNVFIDPVKTTIHDYYVIGTAFFIIEPNGELDYSTGYKHLNENQYLAAVKFNKKGITETNIELLYTVKLSNTKLRLNQEIVNTSTEIIKNSFVEFESSDISMLLKVNSGNPILNFDNNRKLIVDLIKMLTI